MAEEEEGIVVAANAEQSVKCPLYLVSAILQDAIEHAPSYDTNIARQKSLLRESVTKRMLRREFVLRKPRLIVRHSIEAKGPHLTTRIIVVPIEDGEGEAAGQPAEGEAEGEGEDGAPAAPKTQEVEEEVNMAYVDLLLEKVGPSVSELEAATGKIRFSAVETDEEMVTLTVDVNYRTAGSAPEGLDTWVQSFVSRLKVLSEKMVYLNPSLASPTKYNAIMHRTILEKAKRFHFISQTLMRSPSAQYCMRAGSVGGSLQFATPMRPLSTLN